MKPADSRSPLPLLMAAVLLASWPAVMAQEDCPSQEDACRAEPGAPLCSGRGDCVCGQCECHRQHISGRFCECNDLSCSRFEGKLCAGPDHGQCLCGVCACHLGWTGDVCDCSSSNSSCVQPGTDRICNNKGTCECGRCHCFRHAGEGYSGEYCETCPTCVGKCESYRNCVECLAFGTGPLADRCQGACGRVNIQLVQALTAPGADERLCSFLTADDCRYQFVYGGGGGPLRVQKTRACPARGPSPPPTGPAEGGDGAAACAVTVATRVAMVLAVIAAAICGW